MTCDTKKFGVVVYFHFLSSFRNAVCTSFSHLEGRFLGSGVLRRSMLALARIRRLFAALFAWRRFPFRRRFGFLSRTWKGWGGLLGWFSPFLLSRACCGFLPALAESFSGVNFAQFGELPLAGGAPLRFALARSVCVAQSIGSKTAPSPFFGGDGNS